MGVASLVFSIMAVLLSFIPMLGVVAFAPATLGGLLGFIQVCRPKRRKGLAIAGLVLAVSAGMVAYGNFKATDSVVTALTGKATGLLKLHPVYAGEAGQAVWFVAEFENVSDKTVKAFRGTVELLDTFGKATQETEIKHEGVLASGGRIVLMKMVDANLQETALSAASLADIQSNVPFPLKEILYNGKTRFMCKEIVTE
jgi:hypothetical protein